MNDEELHFILEKKWNQLNWTQQKYLLLDLLYFITGRRLEDMESKNIKELKKININQEVAATFDGLLGTMKQSKSNFKGTVN